ncbi:MAG: phosphate/phosphite/phosphonate ABC transporter substrate-binding protein [Proteobacteria bacterium]|nr:phosphate/phosphite/phosphonate ABC transporter substrate-binding protein [Pseudomonadota bacterium]MDP2003328.1 phosphate/phosphite/phosphonate ABC transporter substrate-binding protein [Desulfurivibrionaceae bacterium]PKN23585.1 MAG: phosphonate ABC transporter substrate-binding protein [Deltaproteobacteria bacterium HGW-Deltaproteobacteria-3]MBU4229596.1 phosphate/phosphite/phosphonate ABC transporter substrate-binding protein [Pseudomonadota bacterium]MBU4407167.1 phosphate/phosphite/pho
MGRRVVTFFMLTLLLGSFLGCDRKPEVTGPKLGTKPQSAGVPVYRFAVHPLHNPGKLIQAYQPLIDYLNGRLQGARLALEASRDYANFEKKYQARKPEFLLPNPWQTLQAMKVGYRVIAMAGEPRDFKGIFVVRRDSGLTHPAELRGKSVSYPSPTALAACIMPQYFLHNHGLNVNTDIENRYVGSQESSIMNVHMGQTAAGATWPPPWRAFQKEHPREAAELKVIWETESLINNSVMVRNGIPAQVAIQVRALLLGLEETTEGKSILAGMETARFLPASDEDYDIVRRYASRFESEVRPVEKRW